MSSRIAVICAYNKHNAGMYSVDLAAQHYLRDHDAIFFVAQTEPYPGSGLLGSKSRLWPKPRRKRFGAIPFRRLDTVAQLEGYSHVVYWGDFTNNPAYGERAFCRWDKRLGYSASYEEAQEKWLRLFALTEGRPPGRVISTGQNFQNEFDPSQPFIARALTGLAENFDHILPRDVRSLQNLSEALPQPRHAQLEQGMDCAFLLPPAPEQTRTDTFCTHFGRSGLKKTAHLIAEVERVSGCRAVSLDGRWIGLSGQTAETDFARMREEIGRARFVLTDTYHVSINAMTLSTPVYCLGRSTERQEGTIGDFKKRVLFEMLGGHPFYFETSPAEDPDEEHLMAAAVEAICEGRHRDRAFERVQAAAAQQRDAYLAVLGNALGL